MRSPLFLAVPALFLSGCGSTTSGSPQDASTKTDTGSKSSASKADAKSGKDAGSKADAGPDCGTPPPVVCTRGGTLECTASGWVCVGGGCSDGAPNCYGSDLSMCCAEDPSGSATCSDGVWMCGSVPAPGCSGTSCTHPAVDAGADAANTTADAGPACGARVDGGSEQMGHCASGKCCNGGAVGTFYCYGGDGGCPEVP